MPAGPPISVRLPEELERDLGKFAKSRNLYRSAVVVSALRAYFGQPTPEQRLEDRVDELEQRMTAMENIVERAAEL